MHFSGVVYDGVYGYNFKLCEQTFECDHSYKRCWAVLASVPHCSFFMLYRVILCQLCGHGISRDLCDKVMSSSSFAILGQDRLTQKSLQGEGRSCGETE